MGIVDQPTPISVRVDSLPPGAIVDLESDVYADPDHDQLYQYEYETVTGTERETLDCVRVDLATSGAFGAPPSHTVRLVYLTLL